MRCKKSHVVNITAGVATMMYDSSVFSSPHTIANTCNLCLYHIYRLIMLQQSGIVTKVDSCDKTRCSQIVSGNFTAMTVDGCQKQLTNSFHYLGELDVQRAKDIRLSIVNSESSPPPSLSKYGHRISFGMPSLASPQ